MSFKYEAILQPRREIFFQLNAQSDYEIAYILKLPFTAKYYKELALALQREIGTLRFYVHLADTLFFFNFQYSSYSSSFLLLFIAYVVFEGLKWFL